MSAAESVREIYKDIVIADAPSYSSGINEFTNEQRKAVVEQLGRSGLVSVEEDTAMQNHEAIETFMQANPHTDPNLTSRPLSLCERRVPVIRLPRKSAKHNSYGTRTANRHR